jgi:cell division septum initiation protein DivIVA
MAVLREKFATQVDSKLLATVRGLAREEGRQLLALVEEALTDLIKKRKNSRTRENAMTAYQASHDTHGELYKKLAR